MNTPTLLITLGDVAGVGPEIVAKAWPRLFGLARPVVVGDPDWVRRALDMIGSRAAVQVVDGVRAARPDLDTIPVVRATRRDLSSVKVGKVSAAAGGAAYDFLVFAIDETLARRAAGIVTCPLHKEGLHGAGVAFPGHTEILAERTGASSHAMLLYDDDLPLAVAHVTLHMALRAVIGQVTRESVLDKIRLLHGIVPRLTGAPARIGVSALNPHASDGGLFGDEEATVIAPAVVAARQEGIDATGPVASDAIFLPHNRAKFDGIVAMYHDQGHIAMKLLGGRRAVNVTAGLPIVRTSVAHGTAYDIAGKGVADESSLVSAVRVAAKLAAAR
ncbi:4-hydroxythreonine-4-phosphate dehydrogenase PdxA [Fimbriiglobus ruber]|nr:4-hydroxythreonine-4-phosphate dehydrogenase PdxA [Fimbriiglobus ruber]